MSLVAQFIDFVVQKVPDGLELPHRWTIGEEGYNERESEVGVSGVSVCNVRFRS